MKTLIIGDLQIDASNPHGERAEQTRNTLAWVVQMAAQYRPDISVHLGDYGESNQGVDHYTLSLMCWFAAELVKQCPDIYWLVGNHDYFNDDGSINLMSALEPLLPGTVTWPWMAGPEGTLFLSYLKPGDADRFRLEVGLLFAAREDTVLFSHMPVTGAMYRPGVYEKGGLEPDWHPAQTFVGHYHKPNPPDPMQAAFGHAIWYCGSPMSHDFRDNCYGLTPEQQLRGIWLAEIQNGRVVEVPVFLENPHATYFLSFRADVDGTVIHDDWFNNQCRLPMDRTVVRITPPAGKEKIAESMFQGAKSVNVLLESQYVAPEATALNPDDPPETTMLAYVEHLPEGSLKGLDRPIVERVGTELLQNSFQLPGD